MIEHGTHRSASMIVHYQGVYRHGSQPLVWLTMEGLHPFGTGQGPITSVRGDLNLFLGAQ